MQGPAEDSLLSLDIIETNSISIGKDAELNSRRNALW